MQLCRPDEISTYARSCTHWSDVKHSLNPLEDYKSTYSGSTWRCQLLIPRRSCGPFTSLHVANLKEKNMNMVNSSVRPRCFLCVVQMLRPCTLWRLRTAACFTRRPNKSVAARSEEQSFCICFCISMVQWRSTSSEWVMTHMILTLITSVYVISSPSIPIGPPLVLGLGCCLVCQK